MCRQVTAATRLPLPSMEAHVMFLAGHDPIEIGGELADQAGMGAPRYLSDHGRNPPGGWPAVAGKATGKGPIVRADWRAASAGPVTSGCQCRWQPGKLRLT